MTTEKIRKYVEGFLNDWAGGKSTDVCIYNEFSFQLELGKYLQGKISGYKVQFERNICDFFMPTENLKDDRSEIKKHFYKKEIDIVVFKGNNPWDAKEKYAIELKYIMPSDPTTDKMHEMIEDVSFIQQLICDDNFKPKKAPFNGAMAVTLCNIENFYKNLCKNKNCDKCVIKKQYKEELLSQPTRYNIFQTKTDNCENMGNKYNEQKDKKTEWKYIKSTGKEVSVNPFCVEWKDLSNNYKYYIVE